jgi:hypothetical protein
MVFSIACAEKTLALVTRKVLYALGRLGSKVFEQKMEFSTKAEQQAGI